jgi:hypothetical protein
MQGLTMIVLVSTENWGEGRNVQDRDWFKVEDFAAVKIYIVICFIRLHSVVSG